MDRWEEVNCIGGKRRMGCHLRVMDGFMNNRRSCNRNRPLRKRRATRRSVIPERPKTLGRGNGGSDELK